MTFCLDDRKTAHIGHLNGVSVTGLDVSLVISCNAFVPISCDVLAFEMSNEPLFGCQEDRAYRALDWCLSDRFGCELGDLLCNAFVPSVVMCWLLR